MKTKTATAFLIILSLNHAVASLPPSKDENDVSLERLHHEYTTLHNTLERVVQTNHTTILECLLGFFKRKNDPSIDLVFAFQEVRLKSTINVFGPLEIIPPTFGMLRILESACTQPFETKHKSTKGLLEHATMQQKVIEALPRLFAEAEAIVDATKALTALEL